MARSVVRLPSDVRSPFDVYVNGVPVGRHEGAAHPRGLLGERGHYRLGRQIEAVEIPPRQLIHPRVVRIDVLGQVADDEGPLRSTGHGADMVEHLVHRDLERIVMAPQINADGIADRHEVDAQCSAQFKASD